jgi:hypothetical protein
MVPPMHRILAAAILALLVAAAGSASAAATRDIDLPRLFERQIERAKARTTVPILLPDTLRSDFRRHFPEGSAGERAWSFEIGAVRDCGSATACFIAQFEGRRGARPSNPRRVDLVRGRTGHFRPLSCGASCSPPSIQWRERGTLYSIQANVGTRRTERRLLVRMANSAIRNGPR